MTNWFDSNLNLLSAYNPALAERLRAFTPQPTIEILETPSGAPSLRLHTEGRAHLLHSARDPVREAQRWATTVEIESPFHIMVYGCGLFHHVYQLVKRLQQSLRILIVVEHRLDVLHAVFRSIDLAPFLQNRNTLFLVEPSDTEIRALFNQYLTPLTMDGLTTVRHEPSVNLNPIFYDRVDTVVRESLRSGEILLRTKTQLGGLIQENIIRNLPALLQSPNVSALQNLFSSIPAFIVGAGPSLNGNIDRLSEVGDQGILIAVDTVYRILREKGIEPQIVVSTDPTSLNSRHFEGIDDLGNTCLVFTPSLYHEVVEQLKGTRISSPLSNSRLLATLKDVLGSPDIMPPGINVGQTAYNLARLMGCDPITLVGMDFSFPREGGKTHAEGAALRRTIKPAATEGRLQVELISDTPEWEEFDPIYVPGNVEPEVATSQFWFAYLRSMEEEIRKTSARVINATEGGARIEGTEVMPLGDVIATCCTRDVMIQSTLQMSVGFFFGSGTQEGVGVVRQCLDILQQARTHCQTGLESVQALDRILAKPDPNPDVITTLIDEIRESHKKAIQEQKLYVVLDEAADRVLEPFLKREGRPEGNSPDASNARQTVERFGAYFQGMIRLCDHYEPIVRETLQRLEEPPADAGGFGF